MLAPAIADHFANIGDFGCPLHVAIDIDTAKLLTQEMGVVCKDTDEVTTEAKMLGAPEKEFGWSDFPETAIGSMTPPNPFFASIFWEIRCQK